MVTVRNTREKNIWEELFSFVVEKSLYFQRRFEELNITDHHEQMLIKNDFYPNILQLFTLHYTIKPSKKLGPSFPGFFWFFSPPSSPSSSASFKVDFGVEGLPPPSSPPGDCSLLFPFCSFWGFCFSFETPSFLNFPLPVSPGFSLFGFPFLKARGGLFFLPLPPFPPSETFSGFF
ncbi:unnamed protein product [Acanthosepion pharaonis]|uniref:Uncharacterized protein n=1 Tax=Acanthosepion pharaonis TaxID=158019 RepID=A0A812CZ01_ACAPH|nr:unnamed protein product [Sepia pharaonis]